MSATGAASEHPDARVDPSPRRRLFKFRITKLGDEVLSVRKNSTSSRRQSSASSAISSQSLALNAEEATGPSPPPGGSSPQTSKKRHSLVDVFRRKSRPSLPVIEAKLEAADSDRVCASPDANASPSPSPAQQPDSHSTSPNLNPTMTTETQPTDGNDASPGASMATSTSPADLDPAGDPSKSPFLRRAVSGQLTAAQRASIRSLRMSKRASRPSLHQAGFVPVAGPCMRRDDSSTTVASGTAVFRITDLDIGRELGQGFYGRVLLCRHKFTNEEYVLKELTRSDPEAQAKFVQEMSLLKSLSHPNLVKFIGLFYREERLHLVMEFVDNGTLKTLLETSKTPLSWGLRTEMANDIASGMACLHERSIIHRDLKTENCLVRSNMSVVVADFGLARAHAALARVSGSVKVASMGGHRVPHVLLCSPPTSRFFGKEYNETVDVFSFDPDEVRTMQFGLDETKIRALIEPGCPEDLVRLMMRCACLEPEQRPSFDAVDAELFLLDLKFATSTSISSPKAALLPASSPKPDSHSNQDDEPGNDDGDGDAGEGKGNDKTAGAAGKQPKSIITVC
ncbi:kinase domain-containing protein [Monosiga brevicollis MX1]|uniref:non-specific serine/threonine protein kinase n=1 Tax=Monosiga brevicollis TaxID=81824 RepID=A9UNP1_MONBE|nr:kinase domain-containing protein [Monosiga brevicollis MX1]EDQ92276.1 kinase domain-containing protein [Monosiga brevicollis MX1]|eukprot:XP_001742038.1 kinase domain-containing protein [Monosiga brevicollis MX1]